MKIVICPDSFKGSLSSRQAAEAIRDGILRALPDAETVLIPLADGGEGTVEALVTATGGRIVRTPAADPLGRSIESFFGILGDGKTAVVEMAAASGLPLVPPELRNPMLTTSYGTGELIRAALDASGEAPLLDKEGWPKAGEVRTPSARRPVPLAKGDIAPCRRIILGLGGSATNDGGVGALQALGGSFRNEDGHEVGFGGGELPRIRQIDLSGLDPRIAETELVLACDVDNPLTGPRGAATVFGPQKGASPEMVAALDAGLRNLAEVIRRYLGADIEHLPGAGAAGGLGAAAVAFLGAELQSGIEIVLEATRSAERIRGASLIITGEGRIDAQTLHGKTINGVLRAARSEGVPVIALGGSIEPEGYALLEQGAVAVLSIVNRPMSLDEAQSEARELLSTAAEQVIRLSMMNISSPRPSIT